MELAGFRNTGKRIAACPEIIYSSRDTAPTSVLKSNAEDDFLAVDIPAHFHEIGPEGRGELLLPKLDFPE